MLRHKLTLLVIICAAFVTIAALAAPRNFTLNRVGTGRAIGNSVTFNDGTAWTFNDGNSFTFN